MNAALKNGNDGQYRALLLDFGTVIQKSFFETRADIEKLLQIPPGTLAWAGPFDPESDPLWRQVVSGAFPERAYWDQRAQEVGHLIGQNWTIQDFCRKHGELPPSVILRPEMLALIVDVKEAGLKFGILTNELELFHGKDWLLTMPSLTWSMPSSMPPTRIFSNQTRAPTRSRWKPWTSAQIKWSSSTINRATWREEEQPACEAFTWTRPIRSHA